MANQQPQDRPEKQGRPAPPKFRKFEAPDEDLAPYGVQRQTEAYIDGFVESAKVRSLLDIFGLHERKDVVFPFQHIVRRHGEIWSMRIEPAQDHVVEGEHTHAHHWIFSRQFPELISGVQ